MTFKEWVNFYVETYKGGFEEFKKICKDKRRLGFYLIFSTMLFMLINLLFLQFFNAIAYIVLIIVGGYLFKKGGIYEDVGATVEFFALCLILTHLIYADVVTGSYSLIILCIGFYLFIKNQPKKGEEEKINE